MGRIEIVERDGSVIRVLIHDPLGDIEVMADAKVHEGTLILDGLHMNGPGAGIIGLKALREYTRELGREHGVERVLILGGVRTTGANKGRKPRPVTIEV